MGYKGNMHLLLVHLAFTLTVIFGSQPAFGCIERIEDQGAYSNNRAALEALVVAQPDCYTRISYCLSTSPSPPQPSNEIYPTVVFIGDSLTYSWPGMWNSPSTTGWGMNASSADKDYVHQFVALLKTLNPQNAQNYYTNFDAGQPGGKICHVTQKLDVYKAYQAQLIILQIGENDWDMCIQQFRDDYALVLDALLDNTPVPRIICLGPWQCNSNYAPGTREAELDALLSAVCSERGVQYVSTGPVGIHPSSVTRNNNPGVDWHPNDSGMRGLFELLKEAMGCPVIDWSESQSPHLIASDLQLVEGRTYFFHVRTQHQDGNWSNVSSSDGITIDTIPPRAPTVVDEGAYWTGDGPLRFSISGFDFGSAIGEMQYTVTSTYSGTSGYVIPWTTVPYRNEILVEAPYIPGVAYFCHARVSDGSGQWSPNGKSDGIKKVIYVVQTPGAAKLLADQTNVAVENAVVSSRFTENGSSFYYIQDIARSSGVRVTGSWPFAPGDVITVAGSLFTLPDGERCIENGYNTFTFAGFRQSVKPLHLSGVSTAFDDFHYHPADGSGQRGSPGERSIHLSAGGLLVSLTGRISVSAEGQAKLNSDGLLTILDQSGLSLPVDGQQATITGILSPDGSRLRVVNGVSLQ